MKVEEWITNNPKKATLIGFFILGVILGAILF